MSLHYHRHNRWIQLAVLLLACSMASAASFEFIGIESVFVNPSRSFNIESYAITIASDRRRFDVQPPGTRSLLPKHFIYQTRVKIDNQVSYRLALGNFRSVEAAQLTLQRLQKDFADAWIYRRSPEEEKQLALFLKQSRPMSIGDAKAASPSNATQLLEQARQHFIDGNYTRVIAITDKITAIGTLIQVREALELAGITRERQRKYSQAMVLYEALLETEPDNEIRSRVEARLEGIRTMDLTPKRRIENDVARSERSPWSSRGMLMQFYQDDMVDSSDESLRSVNRVLVTDVDLFVEHRTDEDKLEFRLDVGLVEDFLDDSTESRLSSVSIEYARDAFRVVGGRQRRTLAGVYSSFDGLSFAELSHPGYQLGFAYGYLVQSSFDDFNSDQPVVGASLTLTPYAWLDMSFYLVHQEIFELTEREAVGSEITLQGDNGFAYTSIDYDVFFDRLNNLSLIANYQFPGNWSLDLSVTDGYSPTISTINALQGQTVTSIDELKDSFSDSQIYQLAEDRTGKILNLYIGASYRFDADRLLYFDISSLHLGATEASDNVERIPSSENLQVSIDYSFKGFLFDRDYATVGGRISDSTSSEVLSLQVRTRFGFGRSLSYDPRVRLDRRKSKNDGVEQLILKPSLKVTYRSSEKLSFEGVLGIEYSDLSLPELEDRYTYSYYLGYYYYMF